MARRCRPHVLFHLVLCRCLSGSNQSPTRRKFCCFFHKPWIVDVKMKKVKTKRNQGKQAAHKCSLCGSSSHRIERCTLPGVSMVKKLQLKVKKLNQQTGQVKGVDRVEDKKRKSPVKSASFQKQARKIYGGRQAQMALPVTASEARRRKTQFQQFQTDKQAWDQLTRDHFVPKIRKCHQCGSGRVSGPWMPTARKPCHWRCLSCDAQISWLNNSVFRCLRASPLQVWKLLEGYCRQNPNVRPNVGDLAQFSGSGRKQTDHFICALRTVESLAGKDLAHKKLRGNLEFDGTSLGKFWIKSGNTVYKQQIDLEAQGRKGK